MRLAVSLPFSGKDSYLAPIKDTDMISIYTLTSALHDEAAVRQATEGFLGSIGLEYTLKGNDFSDYGRAGLDLIFVRTGGTEGLFTSLLPALQSASQAPFYLLASNQSNSLAASMEILSYLRAAGLPGEILHGSPEQVRERILFLEAQARARNALRGLRLGVIGKPSDWLIASQADYGKVRERLGIELSDIPMQELLDLYASVPQIAFQDRESTVPEAVRRSLPDARRLFFALKDLAVKHRLGGLTIRCFDLLTAIHNTGCLALALLNAEGTTSGCEGDVPALLSMAIARAVTGEASFQANPSRIDPATGEILFAHCTVPLSIVSEYTFDTHFESGIGVGIRGKLPEGPVTVFKVSGELSRHYVEEGELLRNTAEENLCRTQVVVRLPQTDYFLSAPIGNHHILIPGHHKAALEALLGA